DSAGIEQGQDVGVLEPGRRLDLAQEAWRADVLHTLGVHDLDRDLAIVPQVMGEIHGGHAARAQLALEPIAVRYRRTEVLEPLSHESQGARAWAEDITASPACACLRMRDRRPRADEASPTCGAQRPSQAIGSTGSPREPERTSKWSLTPSSEPVSPTRPMTWP